MEEKRNRRIKAIWIAASIILCLIFAVVYYFVLQWDYAKFNNNDSLRIKKKEGSVTYSGTVDKKAIKVTVYDDKKITYQYNYKEYHYEFKTGVGPGGFTGIDAQRGKFTRIYQDEKLVFEGYIKSWDNEFKITPEEGYSVYDYEQRGNMFLLVTDSKKKETPQIYDVCRFAYGTFPIVHKGEWAFYGFGVLICFFNIIGVLTAEFLFQLHLALVVKDPEGLEASEFEIMNRYFSWAMTLVLAFVVFMIGLFVS